MLSAIVCHEGETLFGGPYIAYCEEEDGNWRKYNDMCVGSDMSDKFTEDYNYCETKSYLLFYVFRNFRSNLKKLKPDFELQFSDMETQDKQFDTEVNIDEENIDEDSDAVFINLDSSEEEYDDDDDDEKDYFTNLIENRKIFFIYNENVKSTSAIFSISNILERRLIKNDKQELKSNCWKEIPELNNNLKLNLNW